MGGQPVWQKTSIGIALAWLISAGAFPASAQTSTQDLKRLSLADLLNIEVTTLDRNPSQATRVPAAVHVITGDDIRRSGARSLPEALRLAPGVQVARINAGTWAIGMRGFADRLARSMLVLIDGRAVYSRLFAGTYWEVQDTLLEDVERIEVIRGPGGTLWGANAVTGIINVVTKRARDSAGAFASVGSGSAEPGFAGFRYGGAAGDDWDYRIYGQAFNRTSHFHPNGLDYDGLRMAQAGFRADWTPSSGRVATVQGDVFTGTLGQRPTVTTYTPPFSQVSTVRAPLSGANVLARWSTAPTGPSSLQVQTFYTRTNRDEVPVGEQRDTFDVEVQQTLRHWARHNLVWGVGYRLTSGLVTAISPTQFTPERRTDSLYSGFVQDQIALSRNRLYVTFGAKIEHNDYTGVEWQPSARLAWTPNSRHTLWWSTARAVRTPSRVETDYSTASVIDASVPLFVRLQPNPDFRSEELVAFETGYRVRLMEPVHVTVSGFYNRHDDVLSTEIFPATPEPSPNPVRVVVPVTFANGLAGNSYGAEITADTRPSSWWRVTGNYSYLRIQLSTQPGSLDGSQEERNEGLSPRHQVQVQSSLDLPRQLSFDVFARYISGLRFGPLPGYFTTNARLAWQVTPAIEVALVGQDLNDADHVEWASGSGNVGIRRSGYVQVAWRR